MKPRSLSLEEEGHVHALRNRMPHRKIAELFGVSRSTIVRTLSPDYRFRMKLKRCHGSWDANGSPV